MTHVDPAARTPWWRLILELEPVVAQAVVRAFFVLLGSVLALLNVSLPEGLEPGILVAVGALYAFIEVVTTVFARRRVTPDAKVLERVETTADSNLVVVAGPAADQAQPGSVVRDYGVEI